jgi:hypothetical protein
VPRRGAPRKNGLLCSAVEGCCGLQMGYGDGKTPLEAIGGNPRGAAPGHFPPVFSSRSAREAAQPSGRKPNGKYPLKPQFAQKRPEDVAWAEEFRPACQVSTSLTRFFLSSCLQNRSATAKMICDSQTHGKSVAPSLFLRSAVVFANRSLSRARVS